eukprot:CAMPEP_0201517218 /NCGR_PEP_ID=MMETSP0161_2-20130828/8378_1 /ASSEMBLY_ACC=CAM_ASM_000251 /TAXON_ID=180227 /ORGANISM="Neoparamoeba aestuarina, Strain SoJaBio B1-5/56/2" /LENGTH=703 /DNA_ID=CAMNT_0047914647 /DNA_START=122 /DNA_END=2230 /DNA_ORIENTATION=-
MADAGDKGKYGALGPPPGAPSAASPSGPPKQKRAKGPPRKAPDAPLPSPPGANTQEEEIVPDKRTFIARELLSTEESYVDGLEGLTTAFKIPLEECLTKEEHLTLFQNIDPIFNFSRLLLADLQKRLESWDTHPCVGDVLVKAIPYMKLYISYINAFNKIQAILEAINQNPKAIQVLMTCQHKQMQGPLGLSSLLMTPIQRIPRYVMLLKDLLDKTPEDHPDHAPLQQAYTSVCEIATAINERKRMEENVQKINEIYQKMDEETKEKVTVALVENKHTWNKGKAESDYICGYDQCGKEISKGSKVYSCEVCNMHSHGAPKKCYEKIPKTCGMSPDMKYLVRAGRQLLRTGSAEHRVVHTNEQYDGVATVNKFSKEIQDKKKCDVFVFNDVIMILWEKSVNENEAKQKGIKGFMSTSPYEFCTLFYYYNPVIKELAGVRSMTPTLLEIRPPSGEVLHSLVFETEEETAGMLKALEDRIAEYAKKDSKVEMDEHGSEIDKSRPVWFTLPSTCPVPDGNGGSFMAYIVNIAFRDSDQEKVVLKRYNQFWILHQKLKKQVGKKNLPYFPPKKWVGNMKPKFVVKRRAELSSYLNKLDVKYLQLECVKHFLSTGCETMEGEMGEGGAFDLEDADAGESSAALAVPPNVGASGGVEEPVDEEEEDEEEEDEEPIGLFLVVFDFKPESDGELTVHKGEKVYAFPGDDKQW